MSEDRKTFILEGRCTIEATKRHLDTLLDNLDYLKDDEISKVINRLHDLFYQTIDIVQGALPEDKKMKRRYLEKIGYYEDED